MAIRVLMWATVFLCLVVAILAVRVNTSRIQEDRLETKLQRLEHRQKILEAQVEQLSDKHGLIFEPAW